MNGTYGKPWITKTFTTTGKSISDLLRNVSTGTDSPHVQEGIPPGNGFPADRGDFRSDASTRRVGDSGTISTDEKVPDVGADSPDRGTKRNQAGTL